MLFEAGIGVKRLYYLKKRGPFWYYRLNPESGRVAGENLNYYTTGCRTREAAEAPKSRHTPTSPMPVYSATTGQSMGQMRT